MRIKNEVDAKVSMEWCCKLRVDGGEQRSDLAMVGYEAYCVGSEASA